MIRIALVAVAMFVLAITCTSCMDQEPGEVTVRAMQGASR